VDNTILLHEITFNFVGS